MIPEGWGKNHCFYITQFRDHLLVVILCFGKLTFQKTRSFGQKGSRLNHLVTRDICNKNKNVVEATRETKKKKTSALKTVHVTIKNTITSKKHI